MRWVRALLGCSVWAALMLVLRHLDRRREEEEADRPGPRLAPPLSVGDEAERWLASRELDR